MLTVVGRYAPTPFLSIPVATREQEVQAVASAYMDYLGKGYLDDEDWDEILRQADQQEILDALAYPIAKLASEEAGERPSDQIAFIDPDSREAYMSPRPGEGMLIRQLSQKLLDDGITGDRFVDLQSDCPLLVATPEYHDFWFWSYRGRLFRTIRDYESEDVAPMADAILTREASVGSRPRLGRAALL